MITFIAIVAGGLPGLAAVKSGAFKEGGGLVLAFLAVIAVVVAAFSGALSGLLPAFIAVWTGRLALFSIAFAIGVFAGDRL